MNEGYTEKGPEHIPTKDEVLAHILSRVENATVTRELSDEQGLYLLEATMGDTESGNFTECLYMRKGKHKDKNETLSTSIFAMTYENGTPVTGVNIFDYDDKTGEWREVK